MKINRKFANILLLVAIIALTGCSSENGETVKTDDAETTTSENTKTQNSEFDAGSGNENTLAKPELVNTSANSSVEWDTGLFVLGKKNWTQVSYGRALTNTDEGTFAVEASWPDEQRTELRLINETLYVGQSSKVGKPQWFSIPMSNSATLQPNLLSRLKSFIGDKQIFLPAKSGSSHSIKTIDNEVFDVDSFFPNAVIDGSKGLLSWYEIWKKQSSKLVHRIIVHYVVKSDASELRLAELWSRSDRKPTVNGKNEIPLRAIPIESTIATGLGPTLGGNNIENKVGRSAFRNNQSYFNVITDSYAQGAENESITMPEQEQLDSLHESAEDFENRIRNLEQSLQETERSNNRQRSEQNDRIRTLEQDAETAASQREFDAYFATAAATISLFAGLYAGEALGAGGLYAAVVGGSTAAVGISLGIFGAAIAVGYFGGKYLALATSSGEPHLTTLDGFAYGFQATGEFVFYKSETLEIQVRFEGAPGTWSRTTKIAIRMGNKIVEQVLSPELKLGVGVKIALDGNEKFINNEGVWFEDGSVIRQDYMNSKSIVAISNIGEYVKFYRFGGIELGIPIGTKSIGLVGAADGNPDNDLVTRSNELLDSNDIKTIQKLYGDFGNSWRLTKEERLFTDKSWEYFQSDYYTALPKTYPSLGMFSQEAQAKAIEKCIAKGVRSGVAAKRCAFDILASGDDSWIDIALASPVAQVSGGAITPVGEILNNAEQPISSVTNSDLSNSESNEITNDVSNGETKRSAEIGQDGAMEQEPKLSDLDQCLNASCEEMRSNFRNPNHVCGQFEWLSCRYRGLDMSRKRPCARHLCERDDQCCGGRRCGKNGICKALERGEACAIGGCGGTSICKREEENGKISYFCR